ncbi:hypothetical protein NA56DRAFT_703640 [Hyaloscypha hepaticicola]|uniref:Uncharacterized protein n=1 Tax=Hyaloscypha hepaticicola TaxID=2082293 RepID=A0A2J6Q5B0_9HELO|nr:hypothetical protein NA56DRAFT_703640 [Hyaloscypha hepaticicola]
MHFALSRKERRTRNQDAFPFARYWIGGGADYVSAVKPPRVTVSILTPRIEGLIGRWSEIIIGNRHWCNRRHLLCSESSLTLHVSLHPSNGTVGRAGQGADCQAILLLADFCRSAAVTLRNPNAIIYGTRHPPAGYSQSQPLIFKVLQKKFWQLPPPQKKTSAVTKQPPNRDIKYATKKPLIAIAGGPSFSQSYSPSML